MSIAVALPYPLIYPQMAQMDDKALTQVERALSEQYWTKTPNFTTMVMVVWAVDQYTSKASVMKRLSH